MFILIMAVILLGVSMIGNGYMKPPEASYEEWYNYILLSVFIVILVGIIMYYTYTLIGYKTIKIKNPDDVLRQRKPWVNLFIAGMFLTFLATTILALSIISVKNLNIIIQVVIMNTVFTITEMILFLVLCWVLTLPARSRYIPFIASKWRIK